MGKVNKEDLDTEASKIQRLPSGAWVKARVPDVWLQQNTGQTVDVEWLPDGRAALDLTIRWEIHRDALPPTQ
jgi:hypothetical protein